MSNEFFDSLFLPDDDGLPMDGLELLEDMEREKENILMDLFELPQFFFNVFFACALTERGRKRLRELETASPELFLTEPFLLLDTYEALYRTGIPEIDHCVKQLLTLFHNETRDDGSPEQTLTVVKAAYPKLYGSCKSAGDAVSIGQLYQKLANEELGYPQSIIERVCYLVSHHHSYNDIDGMDYQILVEADFLVNMYESEMSADTIKSTLNRIFRTKTGKEYCQLMFKAI